MLKLREYTVRNKNNQLTLTRKQLEKLNSIVSHFKEIDQFTIKVSHLSGIGPTVEVGFDLINEIDVKVDITDVSSW